MGKAHLISPSPNTTQTNLIDLPEEILLSIFLYLTNNLKKNNNYPLVCTTFYQLILAEKFRAPKVLQRIYLDDDLLELESKHSYIEKYKLSLTYAFIQKKIDNNEVVSDQDYLCYLLATDDINLLSIKRINALIESKDLYKSYGHGYRQSLRILHTVLHRDEIQTRHKLTPAFASFERLLCSYTSDVDYVNLSGANLNHLSLTEINLQGANLSYADCTGTYFSGANLNRTNLTGANFTETFLSHIQLHGAILTNANFTKAHFLDDRLHGWGYISEWKISEELDGLSIDIDFNDHLRLMLALEICSVLKEFHFGIEANYKRYIESAIKFFKKSLYSEQSIVSKVVQTLFPPVNPPCIEVLIDLRDEIKNKQFQITPNPFSSR